MQTRTQTQSQADTEAAVRDRAERVAALVGSALINPSVAPGPCEGRTGDGVYSVQGAYQIAVLFLGGLAGAGVYRASDTSLSRLFSIGAAALTVLGVVALVVISQLAG